MLVICASSVVISTFLPSIFCSTPVSSTNAPRVPEPSSREMTVMDLSALKSAQAVEATQVNANADIELLTSDSTTGMTSAIEGTYDIGMASRELKEDEAAALAHQAIAMDGIAVIVNLENPTEDMTVEQIASIFLGDATKWNEMVK